MSDGPSFLSLAAAGLYALVALACVIALARAQGADQANWHRISWAVLAIVFVLLLAMRVTGIEESLRDTARALLKAEGAYQERRDFQRVVVGITLVVAGASGVWLAYKFARGSRRRIDVAVKLAIGAGLAMAGLLALRFISLHAVDRLLYGPLKLNWFADVGASLAVIGLAGFYVCIIRSAPKMRR